MRRSLIVYPHSDTTTEAWAELVMELADDDRVGRVEAFDTERVPSQSSPAELRARAERLGQQHAIPRRRAGPPRPTLPPRRDLD
jgi:hypothetical protein